MNISNYYTHLKTRYKRLNCQTLSRNFIEIDKILFVESYSYCLFFLVDLISKLNFTFFSRKYHEKMLTYWNITVMLDYCGIVYSEKQIVMLEKLLNTFLKKYTTKIEPEFDVAKQEIPEILRKEKRLNESNEETDLHVKKCKDFENIALILNLIESENPIKSVIEEDQSNFEKFESEIQESVQEKKSKGPMPKNVPKSEPLKIGCSGGPSQKSDASTNNNRFRASKGINLFDGAAVPGEIDVESETNMVGKDSCKKLFNSEIIIKTTIHKTISPMDEVLLKNMDSREDFDKTKEYQNLVSPLKKPIKNYGNLKLNEDSQFPCKICQKYFEGLKALKCHILEEHSNIEHFSCSGCDIVFKSKPIMEIHQEFVHNCNPLEVETIKKQCIYCEKSFFGWKIVSHLKICEEVKNGCPKCDKVFDLKQGILARKALRDHIKNCHSTENKKSVLCELCGKSSANKRANTEHMKEFHIGDFFSYYIESLKLMSCCT